MKIATTWTYPDGTTGHRVLPKTWGQVSGITPKNAGRFGFVRTSEKIPDPPAPPKLYSKYKLMESLKERGKWDDVKTAIDVAGYWDEWLVAQDLSSDDEAFQTARAAFVEAYGEELVAAVLAEAEI